MAARNVGKLQSSSLNIPFEQIEKTSSTLKRHPKMELSKPDLLQLLGVLEGELQAREIVIAVLKAEQVKQLLYPRKKAAPNDPWTALQRDCFGAFDPSFDETAIKGLYSIQLSQLENFIKQQKNAQAKLKEQLQEAEDRCEKLLSELEEEKHKHAQDTAQGDDVTYLLEKERERLHQENEFERQQNRCMEKDIKCLSETLEQERLRQKQIVLLLLAERKRLILRYVEERQKSERLSQILCDEKGRIADMVDGLEEESKKSLQMEAEMERQLCEFELEKEQFKSDMTALEAKNNELTLEIQKLQEEVESLKKQAAAASALSASQAQLGEGVRSAIVTMVTTPTMRAVPTLAPTVSPPRGVARAVSPKIGPAPATPAKPPGLTPQVPNKSAATPPPKPPSSLPSSTLSSPVANPQTVPPSIKGTPRPTKIASAMPVVSPSGSETEILSPSSAVGNNACFVENVLSPPEADKPGFIVPTVENNVQANQKILTGPKATAIPHVNKTASAVSPAVTNAKKILPIGRGAPPPIPPNKPVLPPQALHRKDTSPKPPIPPRADLPPEVSAEQKLQKSSSSAPRYGVILPRAAAVEDSVNAKSNLEKEEMQPPEQR